MRNVNNSVCIDAFIIWDVLHEPRRRYRPSHAASSALGSGSTLPASAER
jgi:hypothetical protein